MGTLVVLVGVEQARGWLELSRCADTEDAAVRCLKAHHRQMRKTCVVAAEPTLSENRVGRLPGQERRNRTAAS